MKYMNRHKVLSAVSVILLLGFAIFAFAQTQGYFPFTGATFTVSSGGTQTVASGGILDIASGGYLKIAGTTVTSSAAELNIVDGATCLYTDLNKLASLTAGTATASKFALLGTTRNINYIAVDDTIVAVSAVVRVGTGSTLQLDAGSSMTQSGAITIGVQAILADSTLTAARSGYTYIARPVAAKTTATLPAATAGLNFTFLIADADSLILAAAGTDSIIDDTGAAWKKTSSVAGSVKIVGTTGKWWMFPFVGTWTSY